MPAFNWAGVEPWIVEAALARFDEKQLTGRIHRARPDHIWVNPLAAAAWNCGFDDTSHKKSCHSNSAGESEYFALIGPRAWNPL